MAGTASADTAAAFGRRTAVDVPGTGTPMTDAEHRRGGAGEDAP